MAKPAHEVVNFGRNLSFSPTAYHVPRDEEDVLGILVAHRGKKIRAIGRLHSWSEAARTHGFTVLFTSMKPLVSVTFRGSNCSWPGSSARLFFALGPGLPRRNITATIAPRMSSPARKRYLWGAERPDMNPPS